MTRQFKIILIFLLLISHFNLAYAIQVAITVDDLPTHGELPRGITRHAVMSKLLSAFKKHHLIGVYGMINGSKVKSASGGLSLLQQWIDGGQMLGNHTYSHLDLAAVNFNEYIVDIRKNEPILDDLMADNNYRYFRYPYLSEGNTQIKRDSVRQFLLVNGYKVAPVTVDFFEYEWNDAYVRCVDHNDKSAINWLKETYIEQALNALVISHELSLMLFNRDIKNVALVHINAFTAEMMDDLLAAYESMGVAFIDLPEALTDDVYSINPDIVRNRAYTFLNQVRLYRGLENPEIVKKLYASLPEDKLSKICQ